MSTANVAVNHGCQRNETSRFSKDICFFLLLGFSKDDTREARDKFLGPFWVPHLDGGGCDVGCFSNFEICVEGCIFAKACVWGGWEYFEML
jgi:hypothetical protein